MRLVRDMCARCMGVRVNCKFVCMHDGVPKCACLCVCVCLRTCACVCVRARVCIGICMCDVVWCSHACTCVWVSMHMHVVQAHMGAQWFPTHIGAQTMVCTKHAFHAAHVHILLLAGHALVKEHIKQLKSMGPTL